ncbi:hypothetical protein SAMN02910298_02220 [Pseudobutyrivibrio sp. YE44]|uniref:hypothetical protein n=1 Tax=Pseudobutyrivibrio sp. YE44 TaxID=1520802 RepID=UPI000891B727|nr:hypothetical protein [Pseudobutyrivibrio sp. YE44]SDB44750.1 hypothetical protein SAMN02910298_02220 [Pseudobutyrivibrio sp. YE44]
MDNGKMAVGAIGIFGTLFLFAVSIVLFLLGHFYIVNGIMAGFIPFIMLCNAGYSTGLCWGIYGLIILVAVVLQLNFKVARVIFGIFSCFVVSVFVYDANKELAMKTQVLYIIIGIIITGLLNIAGYSREE